MDNGKLKIKIQNQFNKLLRLSKCKHNYQLSIFNYQLKKHSKTAYKYIALLILLPLFLLQGCWLANMPVYVPPFIPTPPVIDTPPPLIESTPDNTATGTARFTIRYEPINSLNPILALNRDNISITSLMYESLFILDENLIAHPLLCESWETEDYITFTFTIYPDIPMHDGSVLTAADVAYSLRQARQRGRRHSNKLRCIDSISTDDELTVTITLNSPNIRFTRLLDIPIIKTDSIEDNIPPGTGPYIFPNPDSENVENFRLIRFNNHRDYADLPLTTIYLRVCDDNEITELFDQGYINLLWDDPTNAFDVRINRDFEPRYYNTTTMQFLGFNADRGVLRNMDVRRALGCAIERQYIVDNIMNNPVPGQAVAAPVAISPAFDLYDIEWERRAIDPLREMAALLDNAGIQDFDSDGYMEIYDGGNGTDFKLYFIVNIENTHKVTAAEYIATCLQQAGIDVEVRVLAWNEFRNALQNGNYDLYYGEVQLGADFDLSPLLLPGDTSLNYGNTASNTYESLINAFLAAETADDVSIAGKELCDDIRIRAPFVPILYKRYAIYTPLGAVSGESPTQSGIFYNFKQWVIDLDALR